MNAQTCCTEAEIKDQTSAWGQALELVSTAALPKAADYEQTIFTGCGSTHYLSRAAAALYQELTGRPARAVSGGELWLNPADYLADRRTLLIAVSRSGTTTETVKAVDRFRAEKRGDVIAVSNYPARLSQLSDVSIVIERGQEESVAQTQSFASMYVGAAAISARMANRADLLSSMQLLPRVGEGLIAGYEDFVRELGRNLELDRFYFLGSGIRYGLACEMSLKMKEMTLTHSEPFQFLEFRHGPMSMVNSSTVVVGMLSDTNGHYERRVLTEMEALGAHIVSLGESDADVSFASGVPESVRSVLYLPVLQMMALHRSLAKGLDPDRPRNLAAVVKLDV